MTRPPGMRGLHHRFLLALGWIALSLMGVLGMAAAQEKGCRDFGSGFRVCPKSLEVENKAYSIDAEYPQLTDRSGKPVQAFNGTVTRKFLGKLPTPKEVETTLRDPEMLKLGQSEENMTYTVTYADDTYLSIVCDHLAVGAGAAHPSSEIIEINWSVAGSREIELGELFTPGSPYLRTLSTYCIDRLLKDPSVMESTTPEDVRQGAGAKAENYAHWALVPEGLLILFQEYQLGPRPVGAPRVTVPMSALSGIRRSPRSSP